MRLSPFVLAAALALCAGAAAPAPSRAQTGCQAGQDCGTTTAQPAPDCEDYVQRAEEILQSVTEELDKARMSQAIDAAKAAMTRGDTATCVRVLHEVAEFRS